MIKEVTTFIRDRVNSPLAVPVPVALAIDVNLFAGHRPLGVVPDPDDCDVVLESSGGTPFFDLPERADVVFQVLSRAKTYMDARDRAWAIYNAIYGNWTLGSAGWRLPLILGESISACDVLDADWGGEALEIDLADKKEGIGSMKDDVAAPVFPPATTYNTVYGPAGTWDWSARKYILFWLKSDRANTAFTYARLVIFDTLGNWRRWKMTFSAGEWTAFKFLLSTGDAESVTLPNFALAESIFLSFQTADDTAFYKKIDNIRVITEEYEIMVLEPLVIPQYIGQDEKRRYEFSTNYIFKMKKF